ncbi:MAG: 2OG-Fe(II) oxygenase [Betaproteobacteria bacterium]
MSAASRQQTLFPLPPASLVAGKTQAELGGLQLPTPRPLPAVLTTNPAVAQARVVDNVFTPAECEAIMAIGAARPREDARVQSYGNSARVGHVAWIDPAADTVWVYQRLATLVVWVNQAFQFDLMGFADALQYTVYGAGHKFDWHVDIGAGVASNRKLSITVQLSDEAAYEGGGLQFISAPDKSSPKTRGAAVLFPSYLAHRVQDVTGGVRCSLVGWAAGGPFR